jgi:hypothetical protein
MFKAIFPNIAYNGRFKTLYEKVIAFPGRKKKVLIMEQKPSESSRDVRFWF